MIHKLKMFGLALGVMLALGATAASSASAIDTFTATNLVETISGTATNGKIEITGPGVSAECATVKLHANVANGSSQGTGEASFEGTVGATHSGHCGSSLGKGEIAVNGCEIVITGTTVAGHAKPWITCSGSNEIELKAPAVGVTIKVPAQTPTGGGITYANEAGKVRAQATVQGITYTCSPAFLCGLGGIPTEGNGADLTGSILMEGAKGSIAFSAS
jgi:uncharacterized protein YfaP (DUF2135 family)